MSFPAPSPRRAPQNSRETHTITSYLIGPDGCTWTCTCGTTGTDWHAPFARRDARDHVCTPRRCGPHVGIDAAEAGVPCRVCGAGMRSLVQIVPIPQGWRVVCEACDTQTATWQREVAERLRDTHQCPRGWDGGEAA